VAVGKLTKAALRAELGRRRQVAALAAVSAELLADGHAFQLALMLAVLSDTDLRDIVLQCSRRAGKTWACLCAALLLALKRPGITCLYLGLNSPAVAEQWRVWLRLLGTHGIVAANVDMTTTLANGSRIEFGGLDDLRHVQSLRGRNLSGCLVILDEAQSDPGVMETTVVDILGPMLDETTHEHGTPGRLIIAGTIPELEGVGYFERLWLKNAGKPDAEWQCMNWSRFDNPHETNNEINLRRYLRKHGYELDAPHVQRTWFGRRVFGDANTVYGWAPKNSYDPSPPTWLATVKDQHPPGAIMAAELPRGARFISAGVDPGTRDEASVTVWAWGEPGGGVWHVFEWETPKNANASQGDWAAVLGMVKARYPGVTFLQPVYDAGSSQEVIDTFQRDYGIGAVLPAKKAARKGQTDRMKTLLRKGEMHVMRGSKLEYDLQNTRWDLAARDKGKWEYSTQHHPCASESGRYAVDSYFKGKPAIEPPKYSSEIEAAAAEAAKVHAERFAKYKPKAKVKPRHTDVWGLKRSNAH
jgi:hypothetical protein